MMKFLQGIGRSFREFGRSFAKDFKEGYNVRSAEIAREPKGKFWDNVLDGVVGGIIIGIPFAVVTGLASSFLSKEKIPNEIVNNAQKADNASPVQTTSTPQKSWAAAEQAKSEAVPEAQLTR